MKWQSIVVLLLACLAVPVTLAVSVPHTSAQTDGAPCGYVDGFDFPVPDINLDHVDFGIYRARFGGLHTGIDVAFDQLGDPVRAAARGQVTYSDIEGWDTEKGVVVIQHVFPDGSLVNTLYGHMEELNGHMFPAMDQCVERGDIIGAIGAPSLGRPHLHYEIRTRYRHEGGPGYTEVNPLELGWLHPVDFTFLARIQISPAYRQHFSLLRSITQPPLLMPDGTFVIAQSTHLMAVTANGQMVWQFDTLGSVTGMVVLPDGRVLATTSANQALILNNGNFSALWQLPKTALSGPFLFGDLVVFQSEDHTLFALAPDGSLHWETMPLPSRVSRWAVSGDHLALAAQTNEVWIVDTAGQVLYQELYIGAVVPFASLDGGFLLLNGSAIWIVNRDLTTAFMVDTTHPITPDAELRHDASGRFYLYTGEGRSLYAYAPDGALLWIAYMPGSQLRAPRLALGDGRLLYALTTDGQLLAYSTDDGRLVAQMTLYSGGIEGAASARWLDAAPDDTVRFSSGFLSVVTLDGLVLLPGEAAD